MGFAKSYQQNYKEAIKDYKKAKVLLKGDKDSIGLIDETIKHIEDILKNQT